jgi:hypothetical protein
MYNKQIYVQEPSSFGVELLQLCDRKGHCRPKSDCLTRFMQSLVPFKGTDRPD